MSWRKKSNLPAVFANGVAFYACGIFVAFICFNMDKFGNEGDVGGPFIDFIVSIILMAPAVFVFAVWLWLRSWRLNLRYGLLSSAIARSIVAAIFVAMYFTAIWIQFPNQRYLGEDISSGAGWSIFGITWAMGGIAAEILYRLQKMRTSGGPTPLQRFSKKYPKPAAIGGTTICFWAAGTTALFFCSLSYWFRFLQITSNYLPFINFIIMVITPPSLIVAAMLAIHARQALLLPRPITAAQIGCVFALFTFFAGMALARLQVIPTSLLISLRYLLIYQLIIACPLAILCGQILFRLQHTFPPGHCRQCGYDLRETPTAARNAETK